MTEMALGSSLKGPDSEEDMKWIKRVDFAKSLCRFAEDGFQSKLYSDLTLRCQDKEFYVHKMVLCSQSEFFANACKPDSPFVEARTGIITLNEDDPCIVQLMLESFYADEYDLQDQIEQRFQSLSQIEAMALSDVLLYAMAEKYQAYHVQSHAVINFRLRLDGERFKGDDRKKPWSVASITRIATKIFETTPDSDRRLRNLVYLYVKNNFSRLMYRSRFETDMDKFEGFWSGYARFLTFFLDLNRQCPRCGSDVETSFDGQFQDGFMIMECSYIYCDVRLPVDEWDQLVDDESEGEDENPRKRRRSLNDEGGPDSPSPAVDTHV